MSKTQTFINIYNTLEEHMRQLLDKTDDKKVTHANLLGMMAKRNPVFNENISRLHAYRSLRNALVHIPYDGTEPESIAEPHDSIIIHYQSLVNYLLSPPSALQTIAIQDITSIYWDYPISDTLDLMMNNAFRLMPIIENDALIGVFDITDMTRLVQVAFQEGEVFQLRPSETFERFRSISAFIASDPTNQTQRVQGVHFANKSSTVEDIEAIFTAQFERQKLVSVICITEKGQAFEPLLGIVTAHDLPNANGTVLLD